MFKFPCDPEFLNAYRRGDRDVLSRVYSEYVEEVEHFVHCFFASRCQRYRLGVRAADLEDVVQEIFIRAFSRPARLAFDAERPYGPFLGALARNLVVDWMRRRSLPISSHDLESLATTLDPAREHESPWANEETMSVVNHYIAQLSPELREVHELRYVQFRTQQETCKALGLSRQQLRTREAHLRDGLRRALKRAQLASGTPSFLGVRERSSG